MSEITLGDHVREQPPALKDECWVGTVVKKSNDQHGNIILKLLLDDPHPDYGKHKCVFAFSVAKTEGEAA